MLILLTQENDMHSDWVEAECQRRGAEFLRFCTERFPQKILLSVEPTQPGLAGELRVEGRAIELEEVTGLWYRRPGPVTLDPNIPEGLRAFSRVESEEALVSFYRALFDRRWVNHPHISDTAGHKLHQLRLAKELGFEVSPTLVTNDPSRVEEFFERCGEEMIYKPLRFVPIVDDQGGEFGIYTSQVSRDVLGSCLDSVSLTPCLFQQLIPKDYEVRVNIIGDRVWAAAIFSQESEATRLDCRHDLEGLRQEAIWLRPEVEEKCLKIHHRLGLRMSNIDLIVTPGGDHVFLELNPNGQWAWIEDQTGLPLGQALVDELLGVDTLGDHPYVHRRSLEPVTEPAYREAS